MSQRQATSCKEKIITPEQLQQAMKVQKESNCRLGSALVKLNPSAMRTSPTFCPPVRRSGRSISLFRN
jgi:hypothetical protein